MFSPLSFCLSLSLPSRKNGIFVYLTGNTTKIFYMSVTVVQVARDFIATLKQNKIVSETKVIVSNHNWEVTPSLQEIGELVARIQSTGADIVKFATTATNITDVSRVLHLLAHSQVSALLCGW